MHPRRFRRAGPGRTWRLPLRVFVAAGVRSAGARPPALLRSGRAPGRHGPLVRRTRPPVEPDARLPLRAAADQRVHSRAMSRSFTQNVLRIRASKALIRFQRIPTSTSVVSQLRLRCETLLIEIRASSHNHISYIVHHEESKLAIIIVACRGGGVEGSCVCGDWCGRVGEAPTARIKATSAR